MKLVWGYVRFTVVCVSNLLNSLNLGFQGLQNVYTRLCVLVFFLGWQT